MIDATWIWDAQLCRMDWANKEGLDYVGLNHLEGLHKIRYNPKLSWVKQLNDLSQASLPDTGTMEKIAFSDGSILNCWVKNHQLENGHPGLWIILKEGTEKSLSRQNSTQEKKSPAKKPATLQDSAPHPETLKEESSQANQNTSPATSTPSKKEKTVKEGRIADLASARKKAPASGSLHDKTTAGTVLTSSEPIKNEEKQAIASQAARNLDKKDQTDREEQEKGHSDSGKILALIAKQINAKTGGAFKKLSLGRSSTASVVPSQDHNQPVTEKENNPEPTLETQHIEKQPAKQHRISLPGMAELVQQMKKVETIPVNDNEAGALTDIALFQGGAEKDMVQTASNSEGIQDAVLVSGERDSLSVLAPTQTEQSAKEVTSPTTPTDSPIITETAVIAHITSSVPAAALVDETGQFTGVSELFALALGYRDEDDFLKKAELEAVLPLVYDQMLKQQLTIKEKQEFDNSRALTKSGRHIALSLTVTKQAESGSNTYYLLIADDDDEQIETASSTQSLADSTQQNISAKPTSEHAQTATDEPILAPYFAQEKQQIEADTQDNNTKAKRPKTKTEKKPTKQSTKTPKKEPKSKNKTTPLRDEYERTLPFLAKVSHEIRTPLNSIIGFSEIMKEEQFGPIENERYLGYLDDIFVSANHALSLVNDMLDISRIQAGSMEIDAEKLNLNDEIHSAIKSMAPQFSRKEIHVWQGLSEDKLTILCDKRNLRQIVLNLVSNAIKYTPKGGQISVSTTVEQGNKVVFRVRDTGIGMSDADIRRAMKPFQRLDTLLKHETDGSGLGLPLTKALIEANKAEFKIESAVDQGTVATVIFSKA